MKSGLYRFAKPMRPCWSTSARCSPEQFFDHFRADGNARHVDAVTAVYVMMHALGKGRVEQIAYDQWREEATDSMVTYASAAIY